MFIAVSPKLGISTLPELIERAKKQPGEISYATTGSGRITHLTMELLQIRAGIKLQMIPYAGGPTQAIADLIAGRVAIVLDGYSGLAAGLARAARSRASRSRPPNGCRFKNCHLAETLPGSSAAGTCCWRRSARRSRSSRKVSADLRTALDDKEVKAKLAGLGAYVRPMSPQELIAFIQEQQKIWKPVAEAVASAQKK